MSKAVLAVFVVTTFIAVSIVSAIDVFAKKDTYGLSITFAHAYEWSFLSVFILMMLANGLLFWQMRYQSQKFRQEQRDFKVIMVLYGFSYLARFFFDNEYAKIRKHEFLYLVTTDVILTFDAVCLIAIFLIHAKNYERGVISKVKDALKQFGGRNSNHL